jgi:hypothetical protein
MWTPEAIDHLKRARDAVRTGQAQSVQAALVAERTGEDLMSAADGDALPALNTLAEFIAEIRALRHTIEAQIGFSSSKGSGWRPSKAASLTHPTPILRPRVRGCPPLPRPQPRTLERLRRPQRAGSGKTRRGPRCGGASDGASSAGGRVLADSHESARIVARDLAPVVSELASSKGERSTVTLKAARGTERSHTAWRPRTRQSRRRSWKRNGG